MARIQDSVGALLNDLETEQTGLNHIQKMQIEANAKISKLHHRLRVEFTKLGPDVIVTTYDKAYWMDPRNGSIQVRPLVRGWDVKIDEPETTPEAAAAATTDVIDSDDTDVRSESASNVDDLDLSLDEALAMPFPTAKSA